VTNPDPFARGPDDPPYRPRPERSIASLLTNLANEIRALFRLEVALFKAELAEKFHRLGRGLAALAIGGFLAFNGWLALVAAAVLALATVVRPWLAALIVGIAAMAVAALLFYLAKRWLAVQSLVPRRTLGSLRQDEAWIGERLP
jgi:Putative Actinobacterial Holin-X, holin superfamily III